MSGPSIHVGIGGWSYEPWRGTFYPADLPKARELDYAVSHVPAQAQAVLKRFDERAAHFEVIDRREQLG